MSKKVSSDRTAIDVAIPKTRLAALQAPDTKQKDHEVALLRSDIAQAIGYCQGLGYPNSYLEKRYPDIAMTSQADTKQTDKEDV